MIKNVFKQLCPSESICQRQVTFRCVITELPDELVRKSSVIVLLNLGVKLLHPANFDEKLGEVFVSFSAAIFSSEHCIRTCCCCDFFHSSSMILRSSSEINWTSEKKT
ncbi:hypothetical protein OIU77_002217 [Salix suchowensis]|uniref:Uncharacterized protein n=1 Tax=Salix suchowensis TaxID=1278906 RepID=A0ABQ9B5D1_9ROSI|nr:hypothetical protein OIU77_002217 [Salix suchowensis]